jgi:hypothetical protein
MDPEELEVVEWIPKELVLKIFSYLHPDNVSQLGSVCTLWHNLISEEYWKVYVPITLLSFLLSLVASIPHLRMLR